MEYKNHVVKTTSLNYFLIWIIVIYTIFLISRAWTSHGANIQISAHDVTTESGCKQMLNMALAMGPIEAIFNLAVVLKDSLFQNQTSETFKIAYRPKAFATMHLDTLSRKLCPSLK